MNILKDNRLLVWGYGVSMMWVYAYFGAKEGDLWQYGFGLAGLCSVVTALVVEVIPGFFKGKK